jgi:hypothetical protein
MHKYSYINSDIMINKDDLNKEAHEHVTLDYLEVLDRIQASCKKQCNVQSGISEQDSKVRVTLFSMGIHEYDTWCGYPASKCRGTNVPASCNACAHVHGKLYGTSNRDGDARCVDAKKASLGQTI